MSCFTVGIDRFITLTWKLVHTEIWLLLSLDVCHPRLLWGTGGECGVESDVCFTPPPLSGGDFIILPKTLSIHVFGRIGIFRRRVIGAWQMGRYMWHLSQMHFWLPSSSLFST